MQSQNEYSVDNLLAQIKKLEITLKKNTSAIKVYKLMEKEYDRTLAELKNVEEQKETYRNLNIRLQNEALDHQKIVLGISIIF